MFGLQDVLQAASAERVRILQALMAHGPDVHALKLMPPPNWEHGLSITAFELSLSTMW